MVVKRVWLKWKGKSVRVKMHSEGWFLFGFLPIYIRERFI